ncbi:hypothetical protein EJ08DRAFT_645529 [Tothia fuscella]|uniref:DUF3844 domain-containing protein n=1 Tax=Tothia fuscella TaxID=1048955 RepID=A0A9P4U4C4_9PEZI|nr:hypothetical protein EJ08DRAFT_645529 [Tothia fuscella]
MRIPTASWLLCAVSPAIAATSTPAQIFLYDGEATVRPTSPETIDAATARLILAQRLELSQYHSISEVDDERIRQINTYGGQRQELFSSNTHDDGRSRVMIVVEGVQDPSIPALTDFSSFSVSPAPHPSDSFQLFSTLSAEAAQTPYTTGPDASTLRALAPLSDMKVNSLNTYNNRRTLLYVKSIAASTSTDGTNQLQTLSSVVTNLYNLAQENPITLSIIFMPPTHLCSKRSTNAYKIQARSASLPNPEQILSEQAPSPAAQAKSSSASVSSSASHSPTKSLALKGAIPTCFSSQSSCERSTNNCTGHGTCVRKWRGPSGEGKKANDCYGCACSIPEVRENKDGSKKTTRFGGGACHKKDVVMPLWLLGSTTVFLVLIVAWGIGLLYSMGSEELPSVIGAGVSGPVKK